MKKKNMELIIHLSFNYINGNYGFVKFILTCGQTERTAGKMRTVWFVGDDKNEFSYVFISIHMIIILFCE